MISQWKQAKEHDGFGYAYVEDKDALANVNAEKVDHVLGENDFFTNCTPF